MRIKLVGPITPERLRDALELAAHGFRKVLGEQFAGFYGANLYLQVYNSDGEPIELYEGGKEATITMRVPAGMLAKPMLSAGAVQRRDARAAEAVQARDILRQADERSREQIEARRAHWRALQAEQARHVRQFARIVEVFGDTVITQCNAAIAEVWARLKPLEPTGPNKGQPRDVPYLAQQDGGRLLYVGEGRSHRRIKTPVSRLGTYAETLEPHWKYQAWVEGAVPALRAVIEGFVRQSPDATAVMATGV